MAIGSEPEIGKTFTLWGKKTAEEKQAWYDYVRTEWHPYLMQGYATLVHNKNNPYYQQKEPRND